MSRVSVKTNTGEWLEIDTRDITTTNDANWGEESGLFIGLPPKEGSNAGRGIIVDHDSMIAVFVAQNADKELM